MAPNLQTCEHCLQPAQRFASIFIWKKPGRISLPRVIAGHPILKHAPHALHFASSTSQSPYFVSFAAMRLGA